MWFHFDFVLCLCYATATNLVRSLQSLVKFVVTSAQVEIPEYIGMSISQMSIELLLFLASILANDETPQITNDANLIVSRDSSGLVDLDGHVTHL
jgi:hypothetical protein